MLSKTILAGCAGAAMLTAGAMPSPAAADPFKECEPLFDRQLADPLDQAYSQAYSKCVDAGIAREEAARQRSAAAAKARRDKELKQMELERARAEKREAQTMLACVNKHVEEIASRVIPENQHRYSDSSSETPDDFDPLVSALFDRCKPKDSYDFNFPHSIRGEVIKAATAQIKALGKPYREARQAEEARKASEQQKEFEEREAAYAAAIGKYRDCLEANAKQLAAKSKESAEAITTAVFPLCVPQHENVLEATHYNSFYTDKLNEFVIGIRPVLILDVINART
jgi:hypothetical protein